MRSHKQNDTAGAPEKRSGRSMTLLLITAAVSFALGMTVGRNTAPVTQVVKVKVPVNQAGQDKLSFYKTLPSGETPALGSGINRPAQTPATAGTYTPSPAPTIVAVAKTSATPSSPKIVVNAPEQPLQSSAIIEHTLSKESGSWILQTASYPSEADAQALCKKLQGKGYKGYVESAAVKGKNWYRVYVGPYSSATAAKQAAAKLGSQDRLTAMVIKR